MSTDDSSHSVSAEAEAAAAEAVAKSTETEEAANERDGSKSAEGASKSSNPLSDLDGSYWNTGGGAGERKRKTTKFYEPQPPPASQPPQKRAKEQPASPKKKSPGRPRKNAEDGQASLKKRKQLGEAIDEFASMIRSAAVSDTEEAAPVAKKAKRAGAVAKRARRDVVPSFKYPPVLDTLVKCHQGLVGMSSLFGEAIVNLGELMKKDE